jgi:RNA polymerase sigma factor (sigma-70 family)
MGGDTLKAENYLFLAYSGARQFLSDKTNVKDTEEYSQACLLLVESIRKYNPEQGDFISFARRKIHNGLIEQFRHRTRKKRTAVVEDVDIDKVCKLSEEKISPDLVYKFLQDTDQETEQERMNKLLLIEIYLGGNKVSEVAHRLNVSSVTVYHRVNAALNKIRSKYSDFIYNA